MSLNGSPQESSAADENSGGPASVTSSEEDSSDQSGIVYVLTNPAMPQMVKIGKTRRDDVAQRLRELYSTGVPVPFQCEVARSVEDHQKVEAALHTAFQPYRVNPQREFFEVEVEQVRAVLELLDGEDVTPQVRDEEHQNTDVESRVAGEQLGRSRRPKYDLLLMGVPNGSALVCVSTGEQATVTGARTVSFRGTEVSLIQATRTALGLDPQVSVRPIQHWSHDRRPLTELYEETFSDA